MALVSVRNVRVTLKGSSIVNDVTFNLSPGDRIALVGPNGMGKTTFLKTLTHELEPDAGRVEVAVDTSIKRLEQWQPLSDSTIYDVASHANPSLLATETRLKHLETIMSTENTGLDDAVAEWGSLSEQFQVQGGYDWESRVKTALQKLGFSPDRWQDDPSQLSGGEAHRLALLRVILSGSEVWLLDEPTNHLDIQAIGWLEETLKAQSAAMIIVSHDRAFLDRVANRTMSWEDGPFWIVAGNWSHYQRLREERLKTEVSLWQRQREEEQRLKAYIDRWRSGTRARQAQSRQKQLSRITAKRPQSFPSGSPHHLHLMHQGQERTGHLPSLEISQLQLQKGTRVWDAIDALSIPLNARIALVGPNGSGKTTLLQALLTDSHCRWHPEVSPAYLSQVAVQELPDASLALDWAFDRGWDREQIYYLGARFGITQSLWDNPLSTWSGGERARLKLLETLMTPAQALILDEPTNHLDVRMREGLERLLNDYPGLLIIASHDRAFLENISTHTWWSTGQSFSFERKPYRVDHQPPL